jgi:flagellar biosynthetic protein FliQ
VADNALWSAAEDESMTAVEVVDIMREGIWVLIKVAGPSMIVSLVIGIVISLFQALTQLQEPTLTFVPKILAIFGTLVITMPFMIGAMVTFMEQIAGRIAGLQ